MWHQNGTLDVEKLKSKIRITKYGLVDEIFAFFLLSHAGLSDLKCWSGLAAPPLT